MTDEKRLPPLLKLALELGPLALFFIGNAYGDRVGFAGDQRIFAATGSLYQTCSVNVFGEAKKVRAGRSFAPPGRRRGRYAPLRDWSMTSISSQSSGRRPQLPAVPPQTCSTLRPASLCIRTSSGTM